MGPGRAVEARQIRIWSLAYLRFWAVKTLTRANPLALFAGSPLYVLYLRLLGAKIGKGVVIFSRKVPGCPDLLTVGDNTVIHKDSSFLCYRARPGIIEKGPVTLGSNVLSRRGPPRHWHVDGQRQPARTCLIAADLRRLYPTGKVWHGSPAARASTNYRGSRRPCSTRRRVIFSLLQLFNRLVLVLPAGVLGLAALLPPYLDTGHLQLGAPEFS